MFCKNCGAEMGESSRFCPRCGNDRMGGIQQKREIVEDNHIRYQVKPEFNLPYQILTTLWKAYIFVFYMFYIHKSIKIMVYISNYTFNNNGYSNCIYSYKTDIWENAI